MKIATTTIKGVELVKVGDWLSAAGQAKVEEIHLSDAVNASIDPEVDASPIVIGHEGSFKLGDAHPAAGWVENLRLSDDKKTMLGDLVGIPTKLASIIPRAFRRRSVEMNLGVSTPGGKTYAAALTALALLGAKAPAVKGLADIMTIYASDGRAQHGDASAESSVALSYDDTRGIPQPTTESVEADPTSVTKNEDSLGKDAEVGITDALKKKLGLAADATDEQVEAALEGAEITPAPELNEDGTPKGTVTKDKTGENAPGNAGGVAPAGAAAAAGTTVEQPGTAALSAGTPGTVTLSAVRFSEMEAQLATLTKSDKEDRIAKQIGMALSSGRISPAEREGWEKALLDNEQTTTVLLSSLQPRFSTIELGGDDAQVLGDDYLAKLEAAAEAAGI